MAVAAGFPESNLTLDPPRGVDLDDCSVLQVFRGVYPDSRPCVISCWKLTQAELDLVNKHNRLWLHVWGRAMPPVHITSEHPFGGY